MIEVNGIKLFKYLELDKSVQDFLYDEFKIKFIHDDKIKELFDEFKEENGSVVGQIVYYNGNLNNKNGFHFYISECTVSKEVIGQMTERFGFESTLGNYVAIPIIEDELEHISGFRVISAEKGWPKSEQEKSCHFLSELLFKLYKEWQKKLEDYKRKCTSRENFDFHLNYGFESGWWFHQDGTLANLEECEEAHLILMGQSVHSHDR